MVEPATVRRLLETIEQRLSRLQRLAPVTLQDYRDDRDLQDIAERNLEVCIQACIDLGLHVLADLPEPLPETNRGVFGALERAGALEGPSAERLQDMAGFRNVLVHGYASIVPEKVHRTLERLDDVREYVRQLTTFMERTG